MSIVDNSSQLIQGHKSDCFGSPVCRKIYEIPVDSDNCNHTCS